VLIDGLLDVMPPVRENACVSADQQATSTGSDHSLLIVGEGEVADALESIAGALGWRTVVTAERDIALLWLEDAKSVVVLSHHDGVDGPVLAAAVAGSASYVGAMGSRRTQARRRTWMLENGVETGRVDSVRGPAGLDIGADTPAEIAVSIVAEIVARSRGVDGGSISDREGPIHPGMAPGTAHCPPG